VPGEAAVPHPDASWRRDFPVGDVSLSVLLREGARHRRAVRRGSVKRPPPIPAPRGAGSEAAIPHPRATRRLE